jgi:hypothetical protein
MMGVIIGVRFIDGTFTVFKSEGGFTYDQYCESVKSQMQGVQSILVRYK